METIIVVPCYNEEKRLPVDDFRKFIAQYDGVSFLFVNDGSSDGTGALLKRLAAENPARFEALELARNGGKAEAVRQGVLHAFKSNPTYVGYWDADLATPLDEVPTFLRIIRQRPAVQMVLGARVQLLGRNIRRNMGRHYVGRAFATVASNYLRVKIYDTQCGSKLLRNTPLLQEIFSRRWVANWLFDVEMLVRYLKVQRTNRTLPHYGIYEQPLRNWRDVKGSKVKGKDFIKAFGELLKIVVTYR